MCAPASHPPESHPTDESRRDSNPEQLRECMSFQQKSHPGRLWRRHHEKQKQHEEVYED